MLNHFKCWWKFPRRIYKGISTNKKGEGLLNSSKYLNGYVSNDDIPILEKKSGDVKVYKDENLTSYIYYTKDELNELYISINEHYDPYDP